MPHTLFVVAGMPASGKTFFATKLASATNAVLLDIDTVSEPIVRSAMQALAGDPDDRDSALFKSTFRASIYDTLLAVAKENLPFNHVVVTGPFTKEAKNENWPSELATKLGDAHQVRCIAVRCSPALRRKRMTERANPRDRSKLEDWERHETYYKDFAKPLYPHLAIETESQENVDQAILTLLADLRQEHP